MSQHKSKITKRETVALEALRQGMALIKQGNKVYGMKTDGTRILLSSSHKKQYIWTDAMASLTNKDVKSTTIKDKKSFEIKDNINIIRIYADGGSRGNPGPSASGYVILTEDESHILDRGGEYLGVTTNNQAEYQAVKLALESAKKFSPQSLRVCLDSLLVVNQLNGVFKVKSKELWPIYSAIKELAATFPEITFEHVYREHNQIADGEVNKVLDEVAGL